MMSTTPWEQPEWSLCSKVIRAFLNFNSTQLTSIQFKKWREIQLYLATLNVRDHYGLSDWDYGGGGYGTGYGRATTITDPLLLAEEERRGRNNSRANQMNEMIVVCKVA